MNDYDEGLPDLRKLRKGDPDAWREMADRMYQRLVRLAILVGVHSADAEDVVQSGMIYTYRYIVQGKRVDDLKGCFRKGLRLAASDYFRSGKAKKRTAKVHTASNSKNDPLTLLVDPNFQEPSERLTNMELLREVQERLPELPDDIRHVIQLRLMEGLTFDEIADVLDTTRGVVSGRFYRGLEKLRKRFSRNSS